MEKIQFYLLDLTYRIVNNRAQICIFGKKGDSKVTLYDLDFRPYFYIIPKDTKSVTDKLKTLKIEKRDITASVTSTETAKKQYLGREVEVVKVYTNLPRAVPVIAKEAGRWDIVESVHEYDIPFTRRYLIDKKISPLTLFEADAEEIQDNTYLISSISSIVGNYMNNMDILAFDIETYYKGGPFNPEKDPIIMVSFYSRNFRKVITYKRFRTEHDYIEFVDDELQLLERFKEIIGQRKPDILAGYNTDGFDFPYIKQRAKKYNLRLDIGIDGKEVRFSRGMNPSAQVNGIIHLDIMQFIRRNIGLTLKTDSYSLDSVAEEILGENKINIDIAGLSTAWENNEELETFAEYNLHDSRLTYRLCERFMPNVLEFTKLVGITAFEVTRMGFSQIVEGYLLRKAPELGILAPNKPNRDEIKERRMQTFEGGFVFKPTPGLYKDIAVFDFLSLYPTIISSHNIGPGTINCSCCRDEAEIAPAEKGRYWFCKKKRGFIPTIIEEVITRRQRIKEIIKNDASKDPSALILLDARQYSLKIMANSFYGYLGFFGARWHSLEAATCVTSYGRDYIKKVIKKAEEEGFNVIYSDTDSIFLTLDGKDVKEAESFRNRINDKLPGIMELELEGIFPAGIFVSAKMGPYGAKKKYALLADDGRIKITGFEIVRSNWSGIAKEVQEEVLNIILKQNDLQKALEYVHRVVKRLKEKKVSKEKIILHTRLTKDINEYDSVGPHVAVAKKMLEKGRNIIPGSIIEYIICQGTGIIRERAKMPEECSDQDYDPDYYINNQVMPAIDKIFEVFGYTKNDLLAEGQKNLNTFFK